MEKDDEKSHKRYKKIKHYLFIIQSYLFTSTIDNKNQRLATFQDVINISFKKKKRKRCLFTLKFINPGLFCAKFDLNSLSGDEKEFFKKLVQLFSQYVYDLFMEKGLSFM